MFRRLALTKVDLDRYYAFFFDTTIPAENTCPITPAETEYGPVLLHVRKSLPFSQPSSILRHGLVANESADDLWRWSSSNGSLTLQVPQTSAKGKTFLNIVRAAVGNI